MARAKLMRWRCPNPKIHEGNESELEAEMPEELLNNSSICSFHLAIEDKLWIMEWNGFTERLGKRSF